MELSLRLDRDLPMPKEGVLQRKAVLLLSSFKAEQMPESLAFQFSCVYIPVCEIRKSLEIL